MAAAPLVPATPPLAPATLALWARGSWDADAAAFLRLVAALVANGHPLRWLHVAGINLPSLAADGPAEARRTLESLQALGVSALPAAPADIVSAIASCERLWLLPPQGRSAQPALLWVDDAWLDQARRDPRARLEHLFHAGQVIRARGALD